MLGLMGGLWLRAKVLSTIISLKDRTCCWIGAKSNKKYEKTVWKLEKFRVHAVVGHSVCTRGKSLENISMFLISYIFFTIYVAVFLSSLLRTLLNRRVNPINKKETPFVGASLSLLTHSLSVSIKAWWTVLRALQDGFLRS